MTYLNAFLVVGTICLIGQIIMDNTKLTNGHITSIFVVIGVILGFLGLYDNISEYSFVGSSIPITSFGNLLYKACIEGFENNGFLGMFMNLLTTTSAGISSAIIFAITITLFCRPKD